MPPATRTVLLLTVAAVLGLTAGAHAASDPLAARAQGVCVILDPPDAQRVEAFAATRRCLVHALLREAAPLPEWRARMHAAGLAGLVSIETWDGKRLPHIDNLVDTIIVHPRAEADAAFAREILRALSPRGLALIEQSGAHASLSAALETAGAKKAAFTAAGWSAFEKPRPAEMDDWTHYRHGADGNAVSKDRIVASPNRLQWIAGPSWNTGRHRASPVESSPNGLLSVDGRAFYTHGSHLVVRDAFNGTLCWRKHIPGINVRNMVLAPDRAFVVLDGALVGLDAATGETRHTYLSGQKISGYLHDAGTLFVKAADGLHAYDVQSGQARWKSDVKTSGMLASEGRLILTPTRNQCLALGQADGKELWKRDLPDKTQVLFAAEGLILTRAGTSFTALDAATGQDLWKGATNKGDALVFAAGGLVWIENSSGTPDHGHPAIRTKAEIISKYAGYDPRSGKVVRSISTPPNVKFRCHPLYATDRFMVGNRPIYFTSWEDGKAFCFEGTRAECGSAYGLGQGLFYGLYGNSQKCMCMSTAISGTTAFASDETQFIGEVPDSPAPRLLKGPAAAPDGAPAEPGAWSMYRYDALRSAAAKGSAGASWDIAWRHRTVDHAAEKSEGEGIALLEEDWRVCKPTGDDVTAPTIAGGRVYFALRHAHQVRALDAQTGEEAWRIDTPARVDAPPTFYKGLCLFGCHDGWVYAVRADTGAEVWRFRAAPDERRMVAYGQLASSWPVFGSVLVVHDTAYVIAGHSTETDGGLYVHALNPLTGEVRWSGRRRKTSEDLFGGYTPRRGTTYVGSVDMLCSDGHSVSIAGCARGRFDAKTGEDLGYVAKGLALGWIPTRYYRDQYGTTTPPTAWLGKGNIGSKKGSIVKSGAQGWSVKLTGTQRIEGLVALNGNGAPKKQARAYRPPLARAAEAADIRIDGVEDPAYAKAGDALALRFLDGRDKTPTYATTGRVLSDAGHLYIFVRCETPHPEKVVKKKTKRDDEIWQDECIELFFDPTGKRTQAYYHLIVNAAGVTQDAWNKDAAWNPDLTVKCGIEPGKAWTAELKIPLAAFNAHGGETWTAWAFNLNRSARDPAKPSQVEDTAWSPTFDNSSHVPRLFGHLWIDALRAKSPGLTREAYEQKLPTMPHPAEGAVPGVDMDAAVVLAAVSFNRPGTAGELQVLAARDGKLLGTTPLPAPPAFDGMAYALGRIYVTLQDGSVVCLQAK